MTTNIELRKRIISIAKENFCKFGYSRVKTNDLVQELGISKRTLYRQFASKGVLLDEVLNSVFDKVTLEIKNIVNKLEKDDNVNFFEEIKKLWKKECDSTSILNPVFLDDLKKNQPIAWKKIIKFREEQLKLSFNKIHSLGVKKGIFKPEIHRELIYLVHTLLINNILTPEVILQLPITMQEATSELFDILLTGTLAPGVHEQYNKNLKG